MGGEDALREPWKYFDLIGGTSTGGLIAIMIGQLKMSIPDCIESYGKLSQNVFGSKSFCAKVFGYYGATIVGGTEYHSKAFEKEVQKLLDHHLPLDQKKLLSQSTSISKAKLLLPLSLQAEYPKVFVAALQQEAANPILLTNYTTNHNSQFKHFAILEAARATSAASTIFEPLRVEVDGVASNFVDAGLGYNCPIHLVMNEARRIWGNRPFGCILSLGTGVQPDAPVGKNLKDVAMTCKDMATNAQRIANAFYLGLVGEDSELLEVYFRLNVDQGLASIRLDEYEKLSEVGARTTAYLDLHQKELDKICMQLKAPTPPTRSRGTR
ncbi:acyl transferase/acyl hydrolase/lysophospholipase [Cladorrhinum samala]|uniref:Acyl transferase/acyl hydrolase/lysophospholipase n=1 Tax=Cladorrhinum samala TaxID=585594 RepID=A0AAV9I132_9PEZI|nr:acyl transferase/acyl hydrolase/lysophospholipase [Cladorrhinum samala]